MTQHEQHLHKTWCTRRSRWFAVLTAPILGPCTVPAMPMHPEYACIGQVMPFVREWPDMDVQQLTLSLYEMSKFEAYAPRGIQGSSLNLQSTLPTCLHSAGNQLYPCQCGCRAALSIERLAKDGLHATLVLFGTSERHMGTDMPHARYLHPQEMFLLNGGNPELTFGKNARLALAAIGQCISPMMSLWILGNVKQHLDNFFDQETVCDPAQIHASFVHDIHAAVAKMWAPPGFASPMPPRDAVTMPPEGATKEASAADKLDATQATEVCQDDGYGEDEYGESGPLPFRLPSCDKDDPEMATQLDGGSDHDGEESNLNHLPAPVSPDTTDKYDKLTPDQAGGLPGFRKRPLPEEVHSPPQDAGSFTQELAESIDAIEAHCIPSAPKVLRTVRVHHYDTTDVQFISMDASDTVGSLTVAEDRLQVMKPPVQILNSVGVPIPLAAEPEPFQFIMFREMSTYGTTDPKYEGMHPIFMSATPTLRSHLLMHQGSWVANDEFDYYLTLLQATHKVAVEPTCVYSPIPSH